MMLAVVHTRQWLQASAIILVAGTSVACANDAKPASVRTAPESEQVVPTDCDALYRTIGEGEQALSQRCTPTEGCMLLPASLWYEARAEVLKRPELADTTIKVLRYVQQDPRLRPTPYARTAASESLAKRIEAFRRKCPAPRDVPGEPEERYVAYCVVLPGQGQGDCVRDARAELYGERVDDAARIKPDAGRWNER